MTIRSLPVLWVLPLLGRLAPAQAPVVPVEEARLQASDPEEDQQFGWEVALQGDLAVVGAALGTWPPPSSDLGRAFVWVRGAAGWRERQELVPAGVARSHYYGSAIALDGDRVVVGDWGSSIGGTVYVFERGASGFVQTALLAPMGGGGVMGFGASVAIDGERIAVAAESGHVFVFVHQGSGWIQEASFVSVPTYTWAEVALDADTLLAYAAGAVDVFARTGGVWTHQATLAPSDPTLADAFGWSLALAGDRALVGAQNGKALPHAGYGSGSVYVFERAGGTWSERAVLYPPGIDQNSGAVAHQFGEAVALEGDRCAVSMPFQGADLPAVFVFDLVAGVWRRTALLVNEHTDVSSGFGGWSITMDEGRVVVGAFGEGIDGVPRAGAAHVYRLTDGIGLALCHGNDCPCGNDDPLSGCANSVGAGAQLAGSGSNGTVADDLVLGARSLPAFATAIALAADDWTRAPFGDGWNCLGGSVALLGVQRADAAGTLTSGPGIASALGVHPGEQRLFQVAYRDPQGPCGSGSNVSNAYEVVFAP